MKRSEMIKLIAEANLASIGEKFVDLSYSPQILALQSAGYVLAVIEEAGMLPPDKRPASSQLTTRDWKIERDKWVQKTFAWEPEE